MDNPDPFWMLPKTTAKSKHEKSKELMSLSDKSSDGENYRYDDKGNKYFGQTGVPVIPISKVKQTKRLAKLEKFISKKPIKTPKPKTSKKTKVNTAISSWFNKQPKITKMSVSDEAKCNNKGDEYEYVNVSDGVISKDVCMKKCPESRRKLSSGKIKRGYCASKKLREIKKKHKMDKEKCLAEGRQWTQTVPIFYCKKPTSNNREEMEAKKMAKTNEMEAKKIAKTNEMEAKKIAKTNEMEAKKIAKTKEMEAKKIAKTKEMEAKKIAKTKEMEAKKIAKERFIEDYKQKQKIARIEEKEAKKMETKRFLEEGENVFDLGKKKMVDPQKEANDLDELFGLASKAKTQQYGRSF